jgi:hypothetical protein
MLSRGAPGHSITDPYLDQHGPIPMLAVLLAWEQSVRTRFGYTRAVFGGSVRQAVTTTTRFLIRQSDRICDEDPAADALITEVRTVRAHCRALIGDTPHLIRLGPCPATHHDGTPCGAGLRADPHAATMRCSKCRTVYRRREWMGIGQP